MTPIWVDEDGALVGHGPYVTLDPGLGPDRFRSALEAIRESGKPMGFASFTFDEAETGSVVKAARAARALTEHGPLEQLTLASDRAATILCRVTEEYYLLLLLARDGNFGRGRFELRKAAAALEKELV